MTENSTITFETETLQKHMVKCFIWMFVGLAVTALVAYVFIATGAISEIMFQATYASGMSLSLVMLLPLFLQLGVVMYLSSRLEKMSVITSKVLFIVYSIITGFTFSFLPAIYGLDNMFLAFGFTAVLFGSLAVIGGTMKLDLTKYSSLIFGALITLVIISVVGIFLNIGTLDMIICYAGLFIFLIITAYDVQKIKRNYEYAKNSSEALEKLSIYGALELYLDFINIFLYVLRILGKKK